MGSSVVLQGGLLCPEDLEKVPGFVYLICNIFARNEKLNTGHDFLF